MNKRQGEVERTWIEIPKELLLTPCGDKITAIIDAVYPDFELNYDYIPYLSQHAIVCPVNTVVDEINDKMLAKVLGDAKDYLSSDTISNTLEKPADFDLLYPIEFLNSISINNFPKHRISLKIGSAVVLLRNINQSLGLCNGIRLMVTRLGDYVFESKIMTGTNIGQLVCIPWIVLSGNSPKWPFTLQRRQFPIRLCYAMTINKCQGQTLGNVGVYLRNPVFTHGQLYVTVLRATSKQGLKLLIEDDDGKPCSTTGTSSTLKYYRCCRLILLSVCHCDCS
jgi:ATP-dependent DNA helicase PIF1